VSFHVSISSSITHTLVSPSTRSKSLTRSWGGEDATLISSGQDRLGGLAGLEDEDEDGEGQGVQEGLDEVHLLDGFLSGGRQGAKYAPGET
jgi:hypothetical protein